MISLQSTSFGAAYNNVQGPLTLEEFTNLCYRQPRDAIFVIKENSELATRAPFELLLALCKTKTPLFESYNPTPSDTCEEILIALIEAGANINGREKITGYTLLHHALENGLDQAALKLLEYGHDAKATLFSNVTPLHLAAQDGFRFRNVIARLVQDKTTLDQVTNDGSSALHFAARAKSIDGVHLLLKAGIDRTKENKFYQTALAVALLIRDNETVISRLQLPEEQGLDVFLSACPQRPRELLLNDNYARAIFQLVQGDTFEDSDACTIWNTLPSTLNNILSDYPDVVKQFSDRLLVRLLKHNTSEATYYLCKKLINFGISVHGKDPETGCLAIHLAVQQDCFFLVETLLNAGADPSAKDAAGNTSLHYSAQKNRDKILELLLNNGANPMVQNNKAQLPLHVAKKGRSNSWIRLYTVHAFPAVKKVGYQEDYDQIIKRELEKEEVVQALCSETSTPLQAVLLLDFPAAPVLALMTDDQKIEGIKLLLAKYPDSLSLILRKFFETNLSHMKTEAVLNTQPPNVPPQDLNTLLRHTNSEEISSKVLCFLQKVADETPFIGTPSANTPALKEFYRNIRNCLSHLVIHLNSAKDTDASSNICRKLAKASNECGTTYLATALDLYNTYCLNITPSLPSAFYEQLQVFRGVVVENMLNESYVYAHQSVHALHHFKRTLGDTLQLADCAVFTNEDPLESNGFKDWKIPSSETVWQSFTNLYSAGCISDWLIELMHDHRYRKFYINWAKDHLQEEKPFIGETFNTNPIAIVLMLTKLNIIKFKLK